MARVSFASLCGVEVGAATTRVLQLLQHHDRSSLADDEAVAVLVEGPTGG